MITLIVLSIILCTQNIDSFQTFISIINGSQLVKMKKKVDSLHVPAITFIG